MFKMSFLLLNFFFALFTVQLNCSSCLPRGIEAGMLASGPVRPVNFTDLMGCDTPECLRIDITSSNQQYWRLIIGEVTPGPQALKGHPMSLTRTL